MARYTRNVATSKNSAQLSGAITSFLSQNKYKLVNAEENIWKKGSFFANPMYVRFQVQPQTLKLEAWLQFMLWPGWYLGEYDLEGMFLVVQKKVLKKHVEAIEQLAN